MEQLKLLVTIPTLSWVSEPLGSLLKGQYYVVHPY